MTDVNGAPMSSIQVDSESTITIVSRDPKIAQFQISGSATEFDPSRGLLVPAIPMVEPKQACIGVINNSPIVKFSYNSKNESGNDARIPVTGMSNDHKRDPNKREDDLKINSIEQDSNDEIYPGPEYRDGTVDGPYQTFVSGEGEFIVPYNNALGGINWTLLGKTLRADGLTPLCSQAPALRCELLPRATVDLIVSNLNKTVWRVFKAAKRTKRFKKLPYRKTAPAAIRRIKLASESLYSSYTCPAGVAVAQNCLRNQFPAGDLLKIHNSIFRRKSPVKTKLFRTIQKSTNKWYRNFLLNSFPPEIVNCSSTNR
jgi:hypothetical protein